MSKEIEVYNAYFGDCIIIKDRSDDRNLLVDFGTHFCSNVRGFINNRKLLLDYIAKDISTRYKNKNISLLITHFHEDHVNGLIHMYENKIGLGLFDKVYISNIWNNPFLVATTFLEELTLEYELKKSGLPHSKSSLFEVLHFLCGYIGNIYLLKRGVSFENNKYTTLWPELDVINAINEESLFEQLRIPSNIKESLLILSQNICDFINVNIIDRYQLYSDEEARIELHHMLDNYSEEYNSLKNIIFENWDEFDFRNDEATDKLNELNHKYNIIFHNSDCCNENLLFTGDAETEDFQAVKDAVDIKLYSNYKYIKIPHHGTENHYFNFSCFNPEKVIITNGEVTNRPISYKICIGYGSLASYHLCTNSNFCLNCIGTCKNSHMICSSNHNIVFNSLFKTI